MDGNVKHSIWNTYVGENVNVRTTLVEVEVNRRRE